MIATGRPDDNSTQATGWYLKRRDLYKHEKPYMFTYDVSELGAEHTNHQYEEFKVSMDDARGKEPDFQLDMHGFAFQSHPTALTRDDFDNEELVRVKYYPEIEALMRQQFPHAAKIHIFAHLVSRKRRTPAYLT